MVIELPIGLSMHYFVTGGLDVHGSHVDEGKLFSVHLVSGVEISPLLDNRVGFCVWPCSIFG